MRAIATGMVIIFAAVAPAAAQQNQAPAAIPVSVVTAKKKPVTKSVDFVGRVALLIAGDGSIFQIVSGLGCDGEMEHRETPL